MKVSLKVSVMTCANCAMAIELTLKKLHGVSDVKVSFAMGSGTDVAKFSTDVILNSGLAGLKEFFILTCL